ncbi:glycoside hydrolase family 47 protein [Dendrothele bispora CBS 962.96]|uniref:alpha-1,2-Mannosidase n=1 Tax=Dendrothele bispora (strain CBS 962.96) TaxID=1314807 RepID=A0A4S8LXW0_DENBC|nr:glycoside hydrolase family 47 protein [Dendrothele bispora CBS 962.96]
MMGLSATVARGIAVLAILSPFSSTVAGPVQKPFLEVPPSAFQHREDVKNIFIESYNAYRKFAFGHDDLLPISRSFSDGRNGWGASIVDGMATMRIMGLDDFFNEAVDFVGKIDFSESQTPDTTTIRYLGGLLSSYELSGKQHHILVEKAKQLTDKMAFAWETRNQTIPWRFVDFSTDTPNIGTSNIAEAGTLDMEWSRLSLYTGNDTYRRLAEGSVRTIAGLTDPLPGLAAQGIDPATNAFVGNYITWGGGSDSYFEYLIKYARLTNTNDNLFADTWHTAVDSSIKFLLRTSTVGDHLYLADRDDEGKIVHISSHLACFHGGNWILGGKLLNNETIVNIGLELVEACWNTYASTATGIGPEVFEFISRDSFQPSDTVPNRQQRQFFEQHGFFITSSDYILRPEVLESNFYAWRVTGDTKYLDRAASAVASFRKFLRVDSGGYSGINDVNDANINKGGRVDDTESFWFAEVLKYLYLTFDDPDHISLDKYVFNTEAQPFEAPPAKPVYGSGSPLPPKGPYTMKVAGAPLPAISPIPALSPNPLGIHD